MLYHTRHIQTIRNSNWLPYFFATTWGFLCGFVLPFFLVFSVLCFLFVYLFVCLFVFAICLVNNVAVPLQCLFYILYFALSNVYLFVCLRYLSCEQCCPCLFSVYSTFSLLLCLTFICLFVFAICLVNNVARASLVFILHSLFCFV